MKGMRKGIALLCGMLCVIFCMFPQQALADAAIGGEYNFTYTDYDVVVSAPDGYVNARYGPGLEYGIMTPIYNGESLHIYAEESNYYDGLLWGQIYYNGSYLWVSLSQTSRISAPAPQAPQPSQSSTGSDYYVMVDAWDGYCNLRTGPGISYAIITPIYNGEILHVTKESYNASDALYWGYTQYKGMEGWISVSQTSPASAPAEETTEAKEPISEKETTSPAEDSIQVENQKRLDHYSVWMSEHMADPEDPMYQNAPLNIDELEEPVFPLDQICMADVTGDDQVEMILIHSFDASHISYIDNDGDGEADSAILHPRKHPEIFYTGADSNRIQIFTVKDAKVQMIYDYTMDPADHKEEEIYLLVLDGMNVLLNLVKPDLSTHTSSGYRVFQLNEKGNQVILEEQQWKESEAFELWESMKNIIKDSPLLLSSKDQPLSEGNESEEPEKMDQVQIQTVKDWLDK